MNHEVLTLDEIDGAFEQAFPGHDLHDESVEFARAVERMVVEKMRAEVEALRAELDIRRKSGSAVERLHNLCAAISAEADGSEWSREEWERIDAENVALRKDSDRLDWLDRQNLPKRFGWSVVMAPAGIVSVQKVAFAVGEPTPIRAALDAARAKEKP